MALIVAFSLALLLTPAARALGLRTGLVDRPGDVLKIHGEPVPVLGGVAVVGAAFGAYAILTGSVPGGLVATVVVLLGVGVVDDARPVSPWLRLAGQAAAGGILVAEGFRLEPLGPAGIPAAVLVIVLSANAVNMMDGQDGLVGGLGTLAALALAALAAWNDAEPAVVLSLAVAGALAGFVLWNRPPARIFLGNGGAYAVGALLAVIGMMIARLDGWRGLLAAGTCLGLFAFELLYTMVRRAVARAPVVPGDRLHSYDIAAALAGSRPRSTAIFWLLGGMAAGLGLAVGALPLAVGGSLLAAVAVIVGGAGGAFLLRRTRALGGAP